MTRLRAVFFDLDDTLVATSQHDERALASALALAKTRTNGAIDEQRLLADFLADFKRVPWDPENRVEVVSWRVGLWKRALINQDIVNADSLGIDLQVGIFTISCCTKVKLAPSNPL